MFFQVSSSRSKLRPLFSAAWLKSIDLQCPLKLSLRFAFRELEFFSEKFTSQTAMFLAEFFQLEFTDRKNQPFLRRVLNAFDLLDAFT